MTRTRTYNSKGETVTLSNVLGKGGEGSVFEIGESKELVAKIYHNLADRDKSEKLSAMVRQKTDSLLNIAAWPVDILLDAPKGNVCGFLMRKISKHKEIHTLYSPKTRLHEFPDAGWPFLIQTAANIARAFSVTHEHGHVIGDVNHGNILVSKQATVLLIDCDSFQINAQDKSYLCEVGVSTHTPPELQGMPFRGLVRSQNHDAFGLAVIVFQLLFMGRHPFSGRYLGSDDMPLERAIKEFRFAYAANAASLQMKQPPGTLSLLDLPKPLGELFEQAFSSNGCRPKAPAWVNALTAMQSGLKQCGANGNHYFFSALKACSWCDIEKLSGIAFFHIRFIGALQQSVVTLDIVRVWAQIEAIQPPEPSPQLPSLLNKQNTVSNIRPSPKAKKARNILITMRAYAVGLVAVSIVIWQTALTGGYGGWLVVIACFIAYSIVKDDDTPAIRELQNNFKEAREKWEEAKQKWDSEAEEFGFHSKKRELEERKIEYCNLSALKQKKLKELQDHLREGQLSKFLDQHLIEYAAINGIGPSRKVILQSYGIETADDIDKKKILLVPGFGPALASKLIDWRRSVERKFVFNHSQGIDPYDLANLEREMYSIRLKLEKELTTGATMLSEIRRRIIMSREAMLPYLESSLNELAQAEVDLKTVKRLTP